MTHLKKFQNALAENNAEAALVLCESMQFYLSGFDFSDGAILVMRDNAYLITDFRYIEAAKAVVDANDFEVLTHTKKLFYTIYDLLNENDIHSILIEEKTLSVDNFKSINDIFVNITVSSGLSAILEELRLYKDAQEEQAMARAQDIADAAFAHILGFIKPEMTEKEVALELEFFMRKRGASKTSFDTIAVSGSASSLPHGVPRNQKLEKGFFTMDFGAVVDGYCSDMTRTVVLGRADAEMKKLYYTVLNAQLSALDCIRAGANCREVDRVARDIIYNAGYEGCFGHGLGHGVGLYIHEAPRLSPGAAEGELLKVGEVVTVEPGIYIEGKYGCRIEDMVIVNSDGCKNFASSPKEMIELF